MSKRLLTVSLAIAVASALIFIPLTAGGQEGRSKDARAGTPAPSEDGGATVDQGAWDGDGPAPRDQVIPDDLIVQFSECVGNDCVNGESFGFDTQRYKENNLRVHFDDTSTSASFPRNDWRITINDSSNGGAEYFAIDDATNSRNPFRILAGAPTNSLHVDAQGDLGLGVANAVVELHIKDGDTPTVRLEQDGSSGFTPQTWDLAGNETNFFIRDVTNGSKLPFRIRPNAPTSSIDVAASGFVGFGTTSPSSGLHLRSTTAGSTGADHTQAKLTLENSSATEANRTLLLLENNGNPQLRFVDDGATTPAQWLFGIGGAGDEFVIDNLNTGAFVDFKIDADGSVFVKGVEVHP